MIITNKEKIWENHLEIQKGLEQEETVRVRDVQTESGTATESWIPLEKQKMKIIVRLCREKTANSV